MVSLENQVNYLFNFSDIRNKFRNKSLNTFEEMFAQKEEISTDTKGGKGQKGGKPQQKDQKKKGK